MTNGDHIVNANHLESASRKAKQYILAEIYDISQAVSNERITPTSFTLYASDWTLNSSETSEFVYYADITVSGLTANDYAIVDFTRASQSTVAEANVCASPDTMSGKIRLYAETAPSASVSGQYVIFKGAS